MKPLHGWCLAALLGAAGLFWWGTQASGGTASPARQNASARLADEFSLGYAGSQCHLAPAGPGHVVLPHRYPNGIGENITALVQSGFLPLQIPHEADFAWFLKPPSQAVL